MNTNFTGVDHRAYARELKARALTQSPRSVAAAYGHKRGDALLTPAAEKLAAFLQLQRLSGR